MTDEIEMSVCSVTLTVTVTFLQFMRMSCLKLKYQISLFLQGLIIPLNPNFETMFVQKLDKDSNPDITDTVQNASNGNLT